MHLSSLVLDNFRSYQQQTFQFSPETNLIIGPNGSGKTNILEAIYFLSCGKSFRASSSSQLIHWDQPFASVRGTVVKNNQSQLLEVQLIHSPNNNGHTLRKFYLEKIIKPRKKFLNQLSVVVFQPEDIRLVTGSPTRRRDFLDDLFISIEWRYASALTAYTKALKHRNELLDQIKIGHSQKNELFYWDQSLVKNADIIHSYRYSFIRHANEFFVTHPHPEIRYLSLNYLPSVLTADKLDKNFPLDLDRGFTQVGIHRDDFSFENSLFTAVDKNLAFWGSRGQQRLAVLAVRLAQIDFFESVYHHRPLLLLDDIFSELDSEHRQLVTSICHRYQTFFTAADEEITTILSTAQIQKL